MLYIYLHLLCPQGQSCGLWLEYPHQGDLSVVCRNVTWSLCPIAGGHVYLQQSGWVFFEIITGISKVLEALRGIGIFALAGSGFGEGYMYLVGKDPCTKWGRKQLNYVWVVGRWVMSVKAAS